MEIQRICYLLLTCVYTATALPPPPMLYPISPGFSPGYATFPRQVGMPPGPIRQVSFFPATAGRYTLRAQPFPFVPSSVSRPGVLSPSVVPHYSIGPAPSIISRPAALRLSPMTSLPTTLRLAPMTGRPTALRLAPISSRTTALRLAPTASQQTALRLTPIRQTALGPIPSITSRRTALQLTPQPSRPAEVSSRDTLNAATIIGEATEVYNRGSQISIPPPNPLDSIGTIDSTSSSPLLSLSLPGGGSLLVKYADSRVAIIPNGAGAIRGQRPIILPRGTAVAGEAPVPPELEPRIAQIISSSLPAGARATGILPAGTWEALARALQNRRRRQIQQQSDAGRGERTGLGSATPIF